MKLEEKLASLALIPEVREACQNQRLARIAKTIQDDEMQLIGLIKHFNALLVRGDHLIWGRAGVPCPLRHIESISGIYRQAGWEVEIKSSNNSGNFGHIFFCSKE